MAVMRTHWVFTLTQWCSCTLNGCSVGGAPLSHWHSCALNGCSGAVPTHSLAFMRTHKNSGGVQYSVTGVHAHSQMLRTCSVLTQMRSFSWPHHVELHSIITQWWSCALIGCSHSLNGGHSHSLGVQGLFPLTHWHSCTFNGCSGGVQYSLIEIHAHSH